MCVVIGVTNPAAETPQTVPETVKPATPAAKENTDDDDDDSGSTQVLEMPNAEKVREASIEEIAEDAVEPAAGFEWYVHIAEDENRFTHEVTRLASTAAAHLVMLAI